MSFSAACNQGEAVGWNCVTEANYRQLKASQQKIHCQRLRLELPVSLCSMGLGGYISLTIFIEQHFRGRQLQSVGGSDGH